MITLAKEKQVHDLLVVHNIHSDVYPGNNDDICVEIHWGDWKKSHIYLKHIMHENGYEHTNTEITEEDGSDCYSAIHTFRPTKGEYKP